MSVFRENVVVIKGRLSCNINLVFTRLVESFMHSGDEITLRTYKLLTFTWYLKYVYLKINIEISSMNSIMIAISIFRVISCRYSTV